MKRDFWRGVYLKTRNHGINLQKNIFVYTMMISIYFLGGIFILISGVFGLYIEKIFEKAKNRPLYVIDDIVDSVVPEVK